MSVLDLFPFISLRSHRETIAAKDEMIALQRDTINQLTGSLESFRETMTAIRKAAAEPVRRAPRVKEPEQPDFSSAAWENIDPEDNEAIIAQAVREAGPGAVNSTRILRRAEQIKNHIKLSRAARAAHAVTPSQPLPAPPQSITDLIDEAIAQGQAAAEGN